MAKGVREIAKRAGVSVGTVSNVLNRPELVSPAKRDVVMKMMHELNFIHSTPSAKPVALILPSFGVMVPNLANPYFADLIQGFQSVANAQGFGVLICSLNDDPAQENFYISMLIERGVLGVLSYSMGGMRGLNQSLVSRNIPEVIIDRESLNSETCSVTVDHELGGKLGVEHLVSLGHTNIVWLVGRVDLPQIQARTCGVKKAAKKLGIKVRTIEVADLRIPEGEKAVETILELENPPSAIFCGNDLLAYGVLSALNARGIHTPRDISILGYDDIFMSAATALPLSTVAQPIFELGASGARLLINESQVDGPHQHINLMLKPSLVSRATTTARLGAPSGIGVA